MAAASVGNKRLLGGALTQINVDYENLPNSDLFPGCLYLAGDGPGLKGEVLSSLLPVGNVGGFRWVGNYENTPLVVLTSTGGVSSWQDTVSQGRVLTYFGDNLKNPDLLDTRGGNKILLRSFDMSYSNEGKRADLPLFLHFERSRSRDWKFTGLAVPGARGLSLDQSLKIVSHESAEGHSVPNYRSTFTIFPSTGLKREFIDERLMQLNSRSSAQPNELSLWEDSAGWWPIISNLK